MAGKPSKYKEETVIRLCTYLELGVPVKHACAAVGVSKAVHYLWLKEHPEYEERVRAAEAKVMEGDLKLIDEHAKKDWRAAAWRLERRFPKQFGRQDKVQLQGDSSKPLTLTGLIQAVSDQKALSDGEPRNNTND